LRRISRRYTCRKAGCFELVPATFHAGVAIASGLVIFSWAAFAGGLATGQPKSIGAHVTVKVVDENGQAIEGAQVTITEPGAAPAQLWTDFAGNCGYVLQQTGGLPPSCGEGRIL